MKDHQTSVLNRAGLWVTVWILAGMAAMAMAQPTAKRPAKRPASDNPPVRRAPVSRARLLKCYDLSHPRIDLEKLLAPGVAKDGIPALTSPKRIRALGAGYPPPGGRVAVVVIGKQAVAYPLGILNYHEIANDTVGQVPIAVIYCPLCDSVAVVDRRLTTPGPDGKPTTRIVELGVSGLLLNSNVVMYDRTTMGLWSQVYMRAITGPDAGRELKYLPVVMMSFADFVAHYPDGFVLSRQTGYTRPYERNPYARYFQSERVYRGIDFGYDRRLQPKTLGMGVRVGKTVVFVTARRARQGAVKVATPRGEVVITANAAGMTLQKAPPGTQSLQTFYHSWSAFYPKTKIIDRNR